MTIFEITTLSILAIAIFLAIGKYDFEKQNH